MACTTMLVAVLLVVVPSGRASGGANPQSDGPTVPTGVTSNKLINMPNWHTKVLAGSAIAVRYKTRGTTGADVVRQLHAAAVMSAADGDGDGDGDDDANNAPASTVQVYVPSQLPYRGALKMLKARQQTRREGTAMCPPAPGHRPPPRSTSSGAAASRRTSPATRNLAKSGDRTGW